MRHFQLSCLKLHHALGAFLVEYAVSTARASNSIAFGKLDGCIALHAAVGYHVGIWVIDVVETAIRGGGLRHVC
jgi:hypothetical protein